MIVRTTNRQRDRIRSLVCQQGSVDRLAAFCEWYERDHSVASKHRVDTAMPAAAWRMVDTVLFEHCYDARGFRTRDVRSVDLNAMKAVRRALNARETHPALFGIGAMGAIPELIPAWKFPGPDASGRRYTPYPCPTMPFVILAPETSSVQGKEITVWVEAIRPFEYPLLDERQHLRFV